MGKDEPKHCKYGPSGAGRVVQCPGSVKLQEGIPDVETPEAAEGTAIHAVVEGKADKETLDREAVVMAERADDYARHVIPEGYTVYREIRVEIWVYKGFERITYGTVDLVAVSPCGRFAIAIDWKFGRLAVPAPADNWQCKLYAVGIQQKYAVQAVEFHIFQPRHYGAYAPATWQYRELVEFADQYARAVALAKLPGLELRPGQYCQYCRAASVCLALKMEAEEADALGSTIYPMPPEDAPELWEMAKRV